METTESVAAGTAAPSSEYGKGTVFRKWEWHSECVKLLSNLVGGQYVHAKSVQFFNIGRSSCRNI
jgi:hypothetical protein